MIGPPPSLVAMTIPDPFHCTLFFFLAFLLAGIVQTVWLRSKAARRFAVAIDAGFTFRSRRIFGANKTWRGFVVMVPAAGLSFVLMHRLLQPLDTTGQSLWPLSLVHLFLRGCWAGCGFMLGELPNSFVKRQCDIAPGAPAHHPVAQRICFLVDQADSVVGGLLAVSLAVPVPRATWLCLTFGGAATHLAFNYGLMRMGLRERAA